MLEKETGPANTGKAKIEPALGNIDADPWMLEP